METTSELLDSESLIDSSPIGPLQITVAILGGLVMFIDGFNTQVIGYITPQIARNWHIPHAMLGPIFSSGLAGVLAGYIGLAPLSGRIGQRRMLIFCTALFGVLTLATSAASSATALIVLRFLTGIGLGGAMPGAGALISEYCPRHRRSTFIVAGNCGVSIGSIVAGMLSAALLGRFGWRPVLWVGGGLPLLLAGALALALPESLDYLVNRAGDQRTALALVRRIAPRRQISNQVRIVAGQGAEATSLSNLFQRGRTFGTIAICVGFLVNLMVWFFVQSWLTTIVVDSGRSQQVAITITSVAVAGGIASAFVIGPLMDKLHPYKVMICFFVVAAVAVALLGRLLSASIPVMMTAAFCAGFCILGIQKSMNAVAVYFYPTALRATGLGWGLGIGRIGAVIGPLIAGMLIGAGWRPASLFYGASAPMLLGAGAMLVLWRVYGRFETSATREIRTNGANEGRAAIAPRIV